MPYRPIFYDTETTGTRPTQDKIIELAAYDPVLQKTFSQLINPCCSIPEEAIKIHHITQDMVKDQPTFAEAIPSFLQFCEGEVVLIAHNNDAFDLPFLQTEFLAANIPMPSWIFFDSLKWARKYRSDLPRHTLQFLREAYHIEENGSHRALNDVKILCQVFQHMIDDLSLETVISLLVKEDSIIKMPFGKYQGMAVTDIPKNYLDWLMKSGALDKNHTLKTALEKLGLLS